MSAIAEVITVDANTLAAYLANKKRDWKALVAGADRRTYGWSGWVFNSLLQYLDEQGITLMDSSYNESLSKAREGTCFALTTEHRRFLDRLDAASFDGRVLRAYDEAFNETSSQGIEPAMLDGIRFLHAAISGLRDGTVCLLVIG